MPDDRFRLEQRGGCDRDSGRLQGSAPPKAGIEPRDSAPAESRLATLVLDWDGTVTERDGLHMVLERFGDVIHIPQDVVVADSFAADAEAKTVPATEIPDGWMGLDIGPESVARFAQYLTGAKTVFWNGPMGVFEFEKFAAGTKGVAEAIVEATRSGAFSVVGGGDSAAAVRLLGLPEDGFSHISTGGGASLEYLENGHFSTLDILD